LAGGVPDDQISMVPREATGLRLQVGPGEVLDRPERAHFAYHLEGALDLPLLDLVGEPRVYTEERVAPLNLLLRPEGYQRVGMDGG
jgi:hypothetical protein